MKKISLTRRSLMVTGAGLAMTTTFGMSARAQSYTDLRNVIDVRLQAIEQILQRDLSTDQKRQMIIQTTRPTIDAATWATGALGRRARRVSLNQMNEFAQIVGDMAVIQEAEYFLQNEGAAIFVADVEFMSGGTGLVLVQFRRPDGTVSMLSYSLIERDVGYLIYNLVIDGSNMGAVYQSEVSRLFESHRGDPNAVIAELAQRRDEVN